jgi:hypothetical protein
MLDIPHNLAFLKNLVDSYKVAASRPDLPFDTQKAAMLLYKEYSKDLPINLQIGREIIAWLLETKDILARHAAARLLVDNFDTQVIQELYEKSVRDFDAKLPYSILKNLYKQLNLNMLDIIASSTAHERRPMIAAALSEKHNDTQSLFEYLLKNDSIYGVNFALGFLLGWDDGTISEQAYSRFGLDSSDGFTPSPKIMAAFMLTLATSDETFLNWLIEIAKQEELHGDHALYYLSYLAHPSCIPIIISKMNGITPELNHEQALLRLSSAINARALEPCQLIADKLFLLQDNNSDENSDYNLLHTALAGCRNILEIDTFEYELEYDINAETTRISPEIPSVITEAIRKISVQGKSLRYYHGRKLNYEALLTEIKSPHYGVMSHGLYDLMAITGKRNAFDINGNLFNNIGYISEWEEVVGFQGDNDINGRWIFKERVISINGE